MTCYIHRLLKWLREVPRRLLAIPESPHETAKAFAVGVFIGVIPGLGSAVALLAAFVFRLNKAAAVLGSLTTNPWTIAFLYAASYRVGLWFTHLESPLEWRRLFTFQVGWHVELVRVAPTIMIGSFLLGLVLAGLSYVLVWFFLTHYKKFRPHSKTHMKGA